MVVKRPGDYRFQDPAVQGARRGGRRPRRGFSGHAGWVDGGGEGSAHALEFARLGAVVARQLAERAAVGRGAEDGDEGLEPAVALPRLGEAEVVGLVAHTEEVEPGLLADQAEAHADVGPAVADGLGD